MASENATPVYCIDTFSEKAKIASFYIETLSEHLKNHAFVSDPHKHDHYLILYITKGGGTHTIDFKTYKVRPRCFFVMTPGQVHSWKLEEGTDGFIMFFEHDFQEFDTLIEPNDPSMEMIVKEMYKEKDDRVLKAWLEVLLAKLSKFEPSTPSHSTFKIRNLERLIDTNFIKLKKPSEYADLMNLSPAYLNNLCKKHLGKTLSDLINERVVLEAKRLLSYADLTVGQISHRLRFSEPSYFIRFFKKNTGFTPEQFKESTIRPIQ